MSIMLLILGLVLFVSLVVVHEFGHFLAARRYGVTVEEFGIGFPPKAWSKKLKSKMLFSINWLPLGGFVKLKGEHDADTRPGCYGAASLANKTKIMLAGVAMNLLAAFVLLTLLAWFGIPQIIDNQYTVKSNTKVIQSDVLVGFIEPDSPAVKAGFMVRDSLVSINKNGMSEAINKAEKLPEVTKKYAGQEVTIIYDRAGKQKQAKVTLQTTAIVKASEKTNNPKGYLGISPADFSLQTSTWSAPIVAGGLIGQFTRATFQGLGRTIGDLFHGNGAKASEQVAGPVGIFVLLKDGSLLGYQFVLMIVAIISLTLAIMNVLPIPALDGGRLFVTWLFRIIRKPLKQKTEELIHGTGFALLMVLFILITIVDIRRYF